MPQSDDQRAKSRFIAISAIRLTGVAMVLFGIAVVQGVVGLPDMAGYLLIVLGMVEAFVVPTVLARAWRSNDRNPPRP